jgi:hypothetical protein
MLTPLAEDYGTNCIYPLQGTQLTTLALSFIQWYSQSTLTKIPDST